MTENYVALTYHKRVPMKDRISTGVHHLDDLIDGLFIGDNVLLYDDAGSLASAFSLNFIRVSEQQKKPLIYVSFDRSPKNLLELLGPLADNGQLIILDCFTYGKGDGSDIFKRFYDERGGRNHHLVKVKKPWIPNHVIKAIEDIHKPLSGDVRFVFESLTGMQDLWGGEEHLIRFYTHSCPRLYELNTIAYWVIEKGAHSGRLKAHINQIAQVAIDLTIKRGKSELTVLKAERRNPENLNKPYGYWCDGTRISFDSGKHAPGRIDIGQRLKALRKKQGVAQSELAKLVGVTPSTISQVESNTIYPSLTALFKIAEVLSVETGYFFHEKVKSTPPLVFRPENGANITFPNLPKDNISGIQLLSSAADYKADPSVIEIPKGKSLSAHFFMHKGEEVGYLLTGRLEVCVRGEVHKMMPGDVICLTSDIPTLWKNIGSDNVRLLWIKIS